MGSAERAGHARCGPRRAAIFLSPSAGPGRWRPAIAGALVLAIGLLLSSCTSGSEADPVSSASLPSATRSEAGPVRHDAEPLNRRFAALGEPVTVTWQSGAMGDSSAPGPSTYWIDAAVRLQPAVAAGLRSAPGLVDAELPDLPADVRAAAGDGPWQSGDALNAAFGSAGFGAQAYLSTGDVVVLRAVGDGG